MLNFVIFVVKFVMLILPILLLLFTVLLLLIQLSDRSKRKALVMDWYSETLPRRQNCRHSISSLL